MKVTLVNPPRSLHDRGEIAPPLGLLRLASAARAAGAEVTVVDFNLLYHTDPTLQGLSFYDGAVGRLLSEDADVYGFTSMAVDSHVALHLAKLIKESRPDARAVMGGTHFSSIAEEVLAAYPWVDHVVKGEGEDALGDLAGRRGGEGAPAVMRSGRRPGELPEPAYDLVDLETYFAVNPNRCLDFEGGRGCRFKCAFCYSPVHYGGPRVFDIGETIEGLGRLARHGAKHVFFVEDNFVNDPAHAVALCREIEGARFGMTWHCYATLPQLTSEVITRMGRAGCTSVFTGVDAVGQVSQRAYRKGFVRQKTELERKLLECAEAGVTPTCAFLLSPPSHPCGRDFDETISVALMARNCGAQVRLNTLTLYNATRSQAESALASEPDGVKPRLMLDVPEVVEQNPYAHDQPQLFPFHSRYVSGTEWESFVSQVHCLFTLFLCYPRTLDALWAEKGVSPREIARGVLAETGSLLEIEKSLRRDAELAAAIPVLEDLTATSAGARALLETESGVLLAA